jgi:hypothetical protein
VWAAHYDFGMKRKIALVLLSLLWLPVQGFSHTHAALNAPIDLTNSRVVPIYGAQSGSTINVNRDAFYSGFLYSPRIVFSAAHSEYGFDGSGNKIRTPFPEIYVGLPNSKAGDESGLVRVEKRIIATNYRSNNGLLDDFVIYILEKDLLSIESATLLTPEIELDLTANKIPVRVHGYGEYVDRCLAGDTPPCRKTEKSSEFPRSLSSILVSLAEAEAALGQRLPYLASHLTILNGKSGFGCPGDSGGSITATYRSQEIYLGPTPNGNGVYACGAAGQMHPSGGVNYSSPVYKHLDILKEAEEYVVGQRARESAAANSAPATAASDVAAEKVVVNKKKTISCYKGKLIKKVTAVNPKCPSGYKKK